jgi:16S rRNA processing protein RimM
LAASTPEISAVAPIAIGRILAVYGLKGWVKVFSFTDPIERIASYSPWLIKKPDSRSPPQLLEIEAVKSHGKGIIALPKGYTDRDQAQLLIGNEIWTPGEQLAELDEGDYYWRELVGLRVVNQSGQDYGKVDHLLETGANDVLVVKADKHSMDDRERLIPFVVPRFIQQVNLAEGKMTVDWDPEY